MITKRNEYREPTPEEVAIFEERKNCFQGLLLEEQYRFMRVYGEVRILDGIYGKRLVHRGEMGQLMGGDRSPSAVQTSWDSLEVYTPIKKEN